MNNPIFQEVIGIAQKLIKAESVSPSDGALFEYIEKYLKDAGFFIEYFNFNQTKNMYAKIGPGPYFCFAGHVDVVPPGSNWKHGTPYSGAIDDGEIDGRIQKCLYGRGANDMKTTIACAMVAFTKHVAANKNASLAFLLTSDEEAHAQDGIKRVVPILKERGEKFSMFILGEPASDKTAADVVKIGRRGSITAIAHVHGQQGHIAYPEHADNPIPKIIKIAQELKYIDFADDDEIFGKSRLEITNINAFNEATNVIPKMAEIRFGIRFNAHQSAESIKAKVEPIFKKYAQKYEINWLFHGNAFVCKDSAIISWLSENIAKITEQKPIFDGKGATSDGRFLYQLAPSIEIGFQENMAHQVDERVALEDIEKMYRIYAQLLQNLDF